MKNLTVQDLDLIHIQIIDASGGSYDTRDLGRLESAISSIGQEAFGEKLYPTIFEKAAVICKGIIADHPFVDGNKRTGIMSALVFLNLNKIETKNIQDEALEDFAVRIAVQNLEIPEIAKWFKNNCKH